MTLSLTSWWLLYTHEQVTSEWLEVIITAADYKKNSSVDPNQLKALLQINYAADISLVIYGS